MSQFIVGNFQDFAITNNISIFILLESYHWDKFLEVELLDQRRKAYVVSLDIENLSIEVRFNTLTQYMKVHFPTISQQHIYMVKLLKLCQ